MTRRTLLIGAGAGVLGVLLASCTPEPVPTPTPDRSPTPQPTGDTVALAAFARSAWTTDPFSLGAVSFTPVGVQSGAREALAAPVDDRLFFAGEATDVEAPGTLAGALRSGDRAAEELLTVSRDGERVAVIGAGLAGAAAAARIADAGAQVTVFEARDRLGGRLHAVVDEKTWPFPAQLGGWLLGAPDDEVLQTLEALDIRAAALTGEAWLSEAGDVAPAARDVVENAIAAAQERPADVSLEEALTQSGADPEDPALAALLAALAASDGADADEVSTWFPPALPPEERTAPLGDLRPMIDRLLGDVRVSLSSPVARVAYDEAGVSLGIATGESLSFDRVVITVPLGVLQSDGIQFSPALPFTHRGAIADLGMGRIETVWLRFEQPITAPAGDDADAENPPSIWHLAGGDATIRTWFDLAPTTGENVLVGIIGGEAAASFADLDDQSAREAAITSLAAFVDLPS